MGDGAPLLHGYHYSVYTRVARLALVEKGISFRFTDVNPFDPAQRDVCLALHPFGRVPVLEHEGRRVYETAAITQLVDEAFDGPALQPGKPWCRTLMRQVIAVVDAYGYWPLVRQVYAQGVFLPAVGAVADRGELERGLAASKAVLAALEAIAGSEEVLDGDGLTLADVHLAPMLACFVQTVEGAELLEAFPRLSRWWAWMAARAAFMATEPGRPGKRTGSER